MKQLVGTVASGGFCFLPDTATGGSQDTEYVENTQACQWAVSVMGLRPGRDAMAVDKVRRQSFYISLLC